MNKTAHYKSGAVVYKYTSAKANLIVGACKNTVLTVAVGIPAWFSIIK